MNNTWQYSVVKVLSITSRFANRILVKANYVRHTTIRLWDIVVDGNKLQWDVLTMCFMFFYIKIHPVSEKEFCDQPTQTGQLVQKSYSKVNIRSSSHKWVQAKKSLQCYCHYCLLFTSKYENISLCWLQSIVDGAFSPDGQHLATASLDGYVKFYEISADDEPR